MRHAFPYLLVGMSLLSGCGRILFEVEQDASSDGSADATPDATLDATPDATLDATPDATPDATLPSGLSPLSLNLPTVIDRMHCVPNETLGEILCPGGDNGNPTDTVFAFDARTESLRVLSSRIPTALSYMSCATDRTDGRTYCFGGEDALGTFTDAIIVMDPTTETWSTLGVTLPTARRTYQGCVQYDVSQTIYCVGGLDSVATLREVVAFNPAGPTVSTLPLDLGTSVGHHVCTTNSGLLHCLDGANLLEINPLVPSVITRTTTAPNMQRYGAALSAGEYIAFGGDDGVSPLDATSGINPRTGASSSLTPLPEPLRRLSCSVAPSSSVIYCFGGSDQTNARVNSIIRYVR